MITTKLISGLGNQLFQYAVGRQLSLLHNTSLCLDLSFYDTQNLRNYRLNNYNIQAKTISNKNVELTLKMHNKETLRKKMVEKIIGKRPAFKNKYYPEKKWWHYDADIWKTSADVYITGYWQHYKYFENLPPLILDELTLKTENSQRELPYFREINQQMQSVSIHIRRGDYITDKNANALMGILPLSYYHEAISFIKQRVSNAHFYIFSDDLTWAYNHLRMDAPATFVDLGNNDQDYIELDLMSSCSHHIIANSSFSWWGAFLKKRPDKIVIAPKQWVTPSDLNNTIQIQRPEWIKI